MGGQWTDAAEILQTAPPQARYARLLVFVVEAEDGVKGQLVEVGRVAVNQGLKSRPIKLVVEGRYLLRLSPGLTLIT